MLEEHLLTIIFITHLYTFDDNEQFHLLHFYNLVGMDKASFSPLSLST